MYICLDCLKIFGSPIYYTETHGLDSSPYEQWDGCPLCGGVYVNAKECSQCGKYISSDYIKLKDGDCVCENCFSHKNIDEIGCDFD